MPKQKETGSGIEPKFKGLDRYYRQQYHTGISSSNPGEKIRMDYSNTHFENDDLDLNLDIHMLKLHKQKYKHNVKSEGLMKDTQDEIEELQALKEAAMERRKSKAKLDLGRPKSSFRYEKKGRPLTPGFPEPKNEQTACSSIVPVRTGIRPMTSYDGLHDHRGANDSNMLARRAKSAAPLKEISMRNGASKKPKSVFYTGVDSDSDDDDIRFKPKFKKRPKKYFGIKETEKKQARVRSRKQLEELVKLEAKQREKKTTWDDVRQNLLHQLRMDSVQIEKRVQSFLANIDMIAKEDKRAMIAGRSYGLLHKA